jgi:hypothetical protein
VKRRLKGDLSAPFAEYDIRAIVRQQRAALAVEWRDVEHRWQIAPGAELIEAVFRAAGSQFHKTKTGPLVASEMHPDGISDEIKGLLNRIVEYSRR